MAPATKLKSIIELDGWRIAVSWPSMYWGESFFVPSTNTKADKKAIYASAKEMNCKIVVKVSTENDVRGLRVWIIEPVLY